MKVYGSPLSPFVRKVLVALQLKELEYEQDPVAPNALPPGYLKISPLGKIPAFTDGDLAIPDSTVICEYLEEQYPHPPLLPADNRQRAQARWFEEYADTRLVELLGGLFFERILKPLFLQQPADEEKVRHTIDDPLPQAQDYLEGQLPAEGFLFGGIGLADISLVSPFINGEYARYRIDAARWPKLAAYIERIKEHPVVAGQLRAEAGRMRHLKRQIKPWTRHDNAP